MRTMTVTEAIEHYRDALNSYYRDVKDNVIYDGEFDPDSGLKRLFRWSRDDGNMIIQSNDEDAELLIYKDFQEWKD